MQINPYCKEIRGGYGTYEKIANGTTLDQLKSTLSAMNYLDAWSTILVVTASDDNGGAYIMKPTDARSDMRQYWAMKAPYNSNISAEAWLLTWNGYNDLIFYRQQIMNKNGTYTDTQPTVSAWELYRLKV